MLDADKNRLERQLDFARAIDAEKQVRRMTHLTGHGRRENDAEHACSESIRTSR